MATVRSTTAGGGQVYFYRRGWEVPRAEHDELQTYRAGGTLSGDFQLGDHSWNWDVGAYVNTNDLSQTSAVNTTPHRRRWAVVLRSGHRKVTCGTPDHPMGHGPGQLRAVEPDYPAGRRPRAAWRSELQANLFP
jgi:iron complex outermembrane receptor protein